MGTHHKGSEDEIQALNSYIKLMRASQSVSVRIHRHMSEHGLTAGRLGVLDALYHLGPLSQLDLARKNLVSAGNITMVVDNLEKRRLVKRERQSQDRRIVKVRLTQEGRALFSEIFPKHVKIIVDEMGALSFTEQGDLASLCRKLGLKNDNETRKKNASNKRTPFPSIHSR